MAPFKSSSAHLTEIKYSNTINDGDLNAITGDAVFDALSPMFALIVENNSAIADNSAAISTKLTAPSTNGVYPGYVLTADDAQVSSFSWQQIPPPAFPTSITTFDDVTYTASSLNIGDLLKWDGTGWIAGPHNPYLTASQLPTQTNVAASQSIPALFHLTDTNFTNLQNDDVIKYDSSTSKWINQTNSSLASANNGNIELNADGTGDVIFKGNTTRGSGSFKLNCENNSHGITIKGPPHSAAASYTLTLPNNDGDVDQVLKTDGAGMLSWVNQSSGGASLPVQSGNDKKFLTTDGTNASWGNTFHELVSHSTLSSTTTTVLDGTTTQHQLIQKSGTKIGYSAKISNDSEYIFDLEETTSSPKINIYKQYGTATPKKYGTVAGNDGAPHQTITWSGSPALMQNVQNSAIDINADGTSLVLIYFNSSSSPGKYYGVVYYYDSSSGFWDLTTESATGPTLLGDFGNSPGLVVQNSYNKFLSEDGTKMALILENGGSSYSNGFVALYTITGTGASTKINTSGSSGSRALINIPAPQINGSQVVLGFGHYGNIADNGYVVCTGLYWGSGSQTHYGQVWLFKADFSNNTYSQVWTKENPLTQSSANDYFGYVAYVDNSYIMVAARTQDNPESGTNDVGAMYIWDYTATQTGSYPAPTLIINSGSTTYEETAVSFYAGTTSESYLGTGNYNTAKIKKVGTVLYVFTGHSSVNSGQGQVRIWKYDTVNGLSNDIWDNIETISGTIANGSMGHNIQLADDLLLLAQGNPTTTAGSQSIITRTFDSTNTIVTTGSVGKITGDTKIVGDLEVTGTLTGGMQFAQFTNSALMTTAITYAGNPATNHDDAASILLRFDTTECSNPANFITNDNYDIIAGAHGSEFIIKTGGKYLVSASIKANHSYNQGQNLEVYLKQSNWDGSVTKSRTVGEVNFWPHAQTVSASYGSFMAFTDHSMSNSIIFDFASDDRLKMYVRFGAVHEGTVNQLGPAYPHPRNLRINPNDANLNFVYLSP